MRSSPILLSFGIALLLLLAPLPSRAQRSRIRAIENLQIDRSDDAWDVTVSLGVPIQLRRHSPASRGKAVQVQVTVLAGAEAPRDPQSLSVPRQAPLPLESVSYEPGDGEFPVLELRFSREVDFEVRQGRDLRSIVLRVRSEPATPREPGAGAAAPTLAPAEDARAAQLVAEGRRALTAGDFERAALILEDAAQRPESRETPEALELLGLARERKGQLAHAKAAYEEYLTRFPHGEGAVRVRQRLDALLTARAEPPVRRRVPRSESRPTPLDFETFGSVYAGYRHESLILDEVGRETFDSSLVSDAYLDTRLRTTRGIVRTHFSGGYRHQFANDDDDPDDSRVSSFFLSFEQPEGGFSGSVGRRSRNTGGVLGRYDGIELGYAGRERWRLGALAGIPIDSSRTDGFGDDRWVGGLSAEFGTFFDALDVGLFAIGQTASGVVDRAAVGGEIRYFRPGYYGALFFDYDFHFQSLNLIQFTGSWQAGPSSTLTGLVDHRNVPFLTARNAIQGQPSDFDALTKLLPDSEIEALAEDRTGRTTTVNLGLSQELLPQLQLALDFTASTYSGTAASAAIPETGSTDIPAFDGTGFEFSHSAQLIASDLLVPGSVGVASLRWFDGSNSDVVTLGLQARAPVVTTDLRVNPRFFTIYQKVHSGPELVALRPSLRMDYRIWKLAFDVEGGVQWSRALDRGVDPPWGYFVAGGCRYDF